MMKNTLDLNSLKKSQGYSVQFAETDGVVNGGFVKQLRKKFDLTQLSLATIFGVSKKAIEKWEEGKNPIKGAAAKLIYLLDKNPEMMQELVSIKGLTEKRDLSDRVGDRETLTPTIGCVKPTYIWEPSGFSINEAPVVYENRQIDAQQSLNHQAQEEQSMTESIPVFYFLGYTLHLAHYERNNGNAPESFEIKSENYLEDPKSHIVTVSIRLNLNYALVGPSIFIFSGGFQINDHQWLSASGEEIATAQFVSTIFPFICQKITAVTDDSRGATRLPALDLRNLDLSKGVKFSLNKAK